MSLFLFSSSPVKSKTLHTGSVCSKTYCPSLIFLRFSWWIAIIFCVVSCWLPLAILEICYHSLCQSIHYVFWSHFNFRKRRVKLSKSFHFVLQWILIKITTLVSLQHSCPLLNFTFIVLSSFDAVGFLAVLLFLMYLRKYSIFFFTPFTCCLSDCFGESSITVFSHLMCQNLSVLGFFLWIQLQLLTDASSRIITFFALFLGQVSFLLSFLNPVFRPDTYWLCLVSPERFSFFYTAWNTF